VAVYYFHDLFMGPDEWASMRCCVKLEVVLRLRHGCHVFFIAGGELSACLSDICFVTDGASQFVYS